MLNRSSIDKLLVWITSALFIGALIVLYLVKFILQPIASDLIQQPTLGSENAPIEILIFEDLLCEECKFFMSEVFPLINKEFIQTGQAHIKLILLTFISDSPLVTTPALCIYKQNEQLFWNFLKEWYHTQATSHYDFTLRQVIDELHGLDRIAYDTCVKTRKFKPFLKNNLTLAKKMIHPEVEVPAVFINGHRLKSYSIHSIRDAIKALQKEPSS